MSDAESDSGGVFDVDRIRRLVELMKEHDLSKIDLRESNKQIRLCRTSEEKIVAHPPVAAATTAASPPPIAPAPARHVDQPEENIVYIRSPMVGTFYSSANPNTESYVKIGDHVDPETTVCIIEAMKVFNEIPAEVRGRIVAVLVENEEAVDHGKPLFKIDTST